MYYFTLLISLAFTAYLIKSNNTRTPTFLLFFAWNFALIALSAIQIFVVYDKVGSLDVDLYIALSLLAFAAGYLLYSSTFKYRSEPRNIGPLVTGRYITLFYQIALLGIAANLGLFIDKLMTGASIFDIETTRSNTFDTVDGLVEISTLSSIAGRLLPLSLISIIMFPFVKKRLLIEVRILKHFQYLTAANTLLLCITGLLISGGRTNIAFVILGYFISNFYLSKKSSIKRSTNLVILKRILLFIFTGTLTLWLSTNFIEIRAGKFSDLVQVLYLVNRIEPTTYAAGLIANNPSFGLLLLSVSYFTSSPPNLDFYLSTKTIPGPFYGDFNFPLITRNLSKLSDGIEFVQFNKVRESVFSNFVDTGFYGNVWSTLLRDLVVDFSMMGAIVFMVFFGFIASLFVKMGQRNNMFFHVIGAQLSIVVIFSPFTGAFSSVFIQYGILYSFIFWLYSRVTVNR